MRMRLPLVATIACFAALITACAGGGSKGVTPPVDTTRTTGYRNPVLDQDFPDPTVIKVGATFWAYATQTFNGSGRVNIQTASSPDLVHWTVNSDALPTKPAWSTTIWSFWAPHVIYAAEQSRYLMYYSARADTSGMCVGIATSPVPQGPFTDVGAPLICGPGFSHIDPMAFDDSVSGKHYIYWGSDFNPIVVRELAVDRLHFASGSIEAPVLFPNGTAPYEGLIEGAWVIKRGGFYYLFYSGNDCCSLPNPHYAVLIARSASPTGPFERLGQATGTGNSVILDAGDYFRGPGHNAIITDSNGNDWIVYHAVDPLNPTLSDGKSVRRPMLIDRIRYLTTGWPYIEGGNPTLSFMTPPVVTP